MVALILVILAKKYSKFWSMLGYIWSFSKGGGLLFFTIYSLDLNNLMFKISDSQVKIIFHATKYVTFHIWSTP